MFAFFHQVLGVSCTNLSLCCIFVCGCVLCCIQFHHHSSNGFHQYNNRFVEYSSRVSHQELLLESGEMDNKLFACVVFTSWVNRISGWVIAQLCIAHSKSHTILSYCYKNIFIFLCLKKVWGERQTTTRKCTAELNEEVWGSSAACLNFKLIFATVFSSQLF